MAFPSRSKIHHAFIELEGKGYIAPRKAFWCCSGCGLAALPNGTEKYVFYHEQDFDCWKDRGFMHLAWGGDAAEIVDTLKRHGVAVSHDGDKARRIVVASTPALLPKVN